MMDGNFINAPNESTFEVSDFFEFDHWDGHYPNMLSSPDINNINPHIFDPHYMIDSNTSLHDQEAMINTTGMGKKERRKRVAFKTKSEVEILDDGFKWRKYGKKMVKNSPNPRNYYRCSVEGCPVKKQVERDKEDPRYVVTTYEDVHNHQSPYS